MKKLLIALLMMFSVLLPIGAKAELQMPQIYGWEDGIARDWNGNPVVDCWAYDVNEEIEKYVLLDKDGRAVKKQETYEVVDETQLTYGWLQLEAVVPEELKGYDVIIGIMGETQSYTFRLYDINDYKAMEEVASGTYRIETASIDGDYTYQYPASHIDEFTVYPGSTAAMFKADFTKPVETQEESQIESTEIIEDEEVKESKIGPLQIIVLTLFAGIIVAGIVIYIKIRQNS